MRTRLSFAAIVLAMASVGCEAPIVRRADDLPAPRTLAELRMKYELNSLPPCQFPRAPQDATEEISPDSGLRLQLPPGWTLRPASETKYDGTPEAVLDGPAESRVRVSRVTSGAIGAQWLASDQRGTRAQATQCQIEQDAAGSIWTLYAPGAVYITPDTSGPVISKPSALGDLITPAGVRYQIRITASSERRRDELAAAVAVSALRVLDAPVEGGT